MKADYIELMDGRSVRMLFNMNAVEIFTDLSGVELVDFANTKVNVGQLRKLGYGCAIEGELADGRELKMSEMEFGRFISVPAMVQMKDIIERQMGEAQKKSDHAPRRPWYLKTLTRK